jgi:hypothetical protein
MYLAGMCKVLGLVPSIAKKKKNQSPPKLTITKKTPRILWITYLNGELRKIYSALSV